MPSKKKVLMEGKCPNRGEGVQKNFKNSLLKIPIKTVFLVVIATLNALGSGPSLISNSKRTKAFAIIQMQGGCSEFPRSRGP